MLSKKMLLKRTQLVRELLQKGYQVRKKFALEEENSLFFSRGKTEKELLGISDFMRCCRAFAAQIQTRKRVLDHADRTASIRQPEVDHTGQEKHCHPKISRL